jgi:hypothetical protein
MSIYAEKSLRCAGRHNPGVRPYERLNSRGVTEITQIRPAARHPEKSVQSVTRLERCVPTFGAPAELEIKEDGWLESAHREPIL